MYTYIYIYIHTYTYNIIYICIYANIYIYIHVWLYITTFNFVLRQWVEEWLRSAGIFSGWKAETSLNRVESENLDFRACFPFFSRKARFLLENRSQSGSWVVQRLCKDCSTCEVWKSNLARCLYSCTLRKRNTLYNCGASSTGDAIPVILIF